MTAVPYPPQSAPPGVPADSTGVYPQLAGYAPIELSRRVFVAAVDAAIAVGVNLLMLLLSFISPVIAIGYFVATLWAVFGKSARLSGVFLGARYVDVRTGRPAGGALLLKSLLAGVIGLISFGIAPIVMVFTTIQQPLQRNWFDRALNLMLVDTRRGRNPDVPAPAFTPTPAVSAPPRGAIEPVTFPGAPAAAPVIPPVSPPVFAPVPATGPSPYDFGPGADFGDSGVRGGVGQGPISPITDPGAVITSTPTGRRDPSGVPLAPNTPPPQVPPPAPPAPPALAAPAASPVVREMRSVDADQSDHTILSPHAAIRDPAGSGAFLDDGTPLSLDPPTVLGRNPQAPGSHPDAVACFVDDLLASKTHLVLGRDEQGPWVIDLHSTNGVSVSRTAGVEPARVDAGRKIHLPVGATVRFGRRTIGIR